MRFVTLLAVGIAAVAGKLSLLIKILLRYFKRVAPLYSFHGYRKSRQNENTAKDNVTVKISIS